MPFLSLNQQYQSTEGKKTSLTEPYPFSSTNTKMGRSVVPFHIGPLTPIHKWKICNGVVDCCIIWLAEERYLMTGTIVFCYQYRYLKEDEKNAQGDANTARVLAVRFGQRPPASCHKPTDRTNYNTLHRS